MSFTLIYTDRSVSPLPAGFSFYIPELHISLINNLPPTASSITAECFAIIESLNTISSLPPRKFLIAKDSLFYVQALCFNVFKYYSSSISIKVRSLYIGDFIIESILFLFFYLADLKYIFSWNLSIFLY